MTLSYADKCARLAADIRTRDTEIRLRKTTTNLFRWRERSEAGLDVRDFDQVIEVNSQEGWVDAEGMMPYHALVDACLPHGVMPAVVPELKSITVGGAVAGTGLESSSFRYGFVHETMLELDVLLADGSIVTCTPDNAHADLFFGLPNSYGTLGYALRVRLKTVPVKPFVRITHTVCEGPVAFFARLEDLHTEPDIDFLEGVVFSETSHVISEARMVADAPYTSDYSFENIYYRSLLDRSEDFLSIRDYIWRWDTDWFWCSKELGAQNPVIRRLLGRERLNSMFYMKVRQWARRSGVLTLRNTIMRGRNEAIIQDVEIPVRNAADFMAFFHDQIGLTPVIVGPVIGSPTHAARFPLFPLDPDTLYVNIGFWRGKKTTHEPGYFNRIIERRVRDLGGLKMLYSESFYSPEEFWDLYGGEAHYRSLKAKYDPTRKLADLYRKVVGSPATAAETTTT